MNELYSYPSNDYRSYLAHHGVKGMKWGVRHEQARKARMMKKYGITASQYDSVRAKSLQRHKYGNAAKGAVSGVVHLANLPNYSNGIKSGISFAQEAGLGGAGPIIGTAIGLIAGTARNIAIKQAMVSIPWKIGRTIFDSIVESSDFKEISNNRNSSEGQTEREVLDDLLSDTSGMSKEERDLIAELDRDYNRR